MHLEEPIVIYTAESNFEAHAIVEMLVATGINAYAVEDHSPASIGWLGVMSQIHQPNVFVEKSATEEAAKIILQFENTRRLRQEAMAGTATIPTPCDACGKMTDFPASLNGTTQICKHCHAYVDVGETFSNEDAAPFDE